MEFLRFGSSIPGEYWGCCAACIIQNFKQDPDTKCSIQKVSGDGGGPVVPNGGFVYYGTTLREIFWSRLREGTFGSGDMPNHAFFAILTEGQIKGVVGKKWLEILREAGFEFLRTQDNSVWSPKKNYIFALFRNIGPHDVKDAFTPPKEWTDLPKVKTEAWECLFKDADYLSCLPGGELNTLTERQKSEDRVIYDRIGPAKLYTEAELKEAGAPVILSGLRSAFPPQKKEVREAKMQELVQKGIQYVPSPGTNMPY